MPPVAQNTVYPIRTARRSLSYIFTPKHHGGDSRAACWLAEISFDDEFAIFDKADGDEEEKDGDSRQVADKDGNLYGYKVLENEKLHLMILGKWGEQLSEYPYQKDVQHWHGYPVFPIDELGPENRQGQRCRPEKDIFDRMMMLGDIDRGQRKRLMTGSHV